MLDKLRKSEAELEAKKAECTKLKQKFKVTKNTDISNNKRTSSVTNNDVLLYRSMPRFQTQLSSSLLRVKRQEMGQMLTASQSEECLLSARELVCFCRDSRHLLHLRKTKVQLLHVLYVIKYIWYVDAVGLPNPEIPFCN